MHIISKEFEWCQMDVVYSSTTNALLFMVKQIKVHVFF